MWKEDEKMGVCLENREPEFLEEPGQEGAWITTLGRRVFLLSICMGRDGRRKGQLKYLCSKEPFYFSDLTEAVLIMEEILDDYMPPRSPSLIRSFEGSKRRRNSSCERLMYREAEDGEEEKFYIQIRYRQNSSWQGEVRWQNGRKREYFRSVLELLNLLDSVFDGKGEKAGS